MTYHTLFELESCAEQGGANILLVGQKIYEFWPILYQSEVKNTKERK